MDENYLDSLLNEISLDNEIDEDMKRSQHGKTIELKADTFNHMMSQDSDARLSSEDNISGESAFDELDELDRMADVDISDLDFADLDFDDLDMLNTTPKQGAQVKHASPSEKKHASREEEVSEIDLDALSIDDMFFEPPAGDEQGTEDANASTSVSPKAQTVSSALAQSDIPADLSNMDPGLAQSVDSLNADDFLLNFSNFQENIDESQSNAVPTASDDMGMAPIAGSDKPGNGEEDANINDLLEMLGIEDDELEDGTRHTDGQTIDSQAAFSEGKEAGMPEDLNSFLDESISGVDDISETKPKHSLLQLLFGSDDDDELELSDEELAAIKAEKKAKRDAKKAERQAKTDEKKAAKAAKDAEINADKAAKKALKAARRKEELDSAPPEKKLNRTAVMIIAVFFASVMAVIILGTNTFNYKLVIQKAANYFERQKYHMAYDEIAGVEVKKEDQELEDKIYTVMYVERLYESYETNVKLGRPDKALDSLLRGLTKYDEHYAEAEELNIVADINSSRDKIVAALLSTYGLTVDDAYAILALDSYEYRARLDLYAVDQGNDSVILDNTTEQAGTNSGEAQQ